MSEEDAVKQQQSALQYARMWGEHSVPPTLLATFITAQHARPFQILPMMFTPLLLFSSYANLGGFKKDAAGMTAAWSGLYLLLAARRKQKFTAKLSPRGAIRGITLGLCVANLVGGGVAYVFGNREKEEDER